METVVLVLAAGFIILWLELGYLLVQCMLGWTPALALAVLVHWIARRHGLDAIEAMAAAGVAAFLVRRAMEPRTYHGKSHEPRPVDHAQRG